MFYPRFQIIKNIYKYWIVAIVLNADNISIFQINYILFRNMWDIHCRINFIMALFSIKKNTWSWTRQLKFNYRKTYRWAIKRERAVLCKVFLQTLQNAYFFLFLSFKTSKFNSEKLVVCGRPAIFTLCVKCQCCHIKNEK